MACWRRAGSWRPPVLRTRPDAEDAHRRLFRLDAGTRLLHRPGAGRALHAPRETAARRQHASPAGGDVQGLRARARRGNAARRSPARRAELEGADRMIAIVDYGVGNLANLERALRRAGATDVRITRSHVEMVAAR